MVLAALLYFSNSSKSYSNNYEDQYCDIETTLIRTVDKEGNILDETTEEKVVCNDGVKIFYKMLVLQMSVIFTHITCH